MKVKIESFKIVCDCCGDTFHNSDDFVCYTDDIDGSMIKNEAISSDWIEVGDKHFCPRCYDYDDKDNYNIVTKDGHKYDYDTGKEL